MHAIIIFLAISSVIFIARSMHSDYTGHAWIKWDPKRKIDYVMRAMAVLKKRKKHIKNNPEFYIAEIDMFYLKDESNLQHNLSSVLHNLTKVYERA